MKMIASLCGLVAVLTLAQGVPRPEVRNLQEDIDRGVAADKLFGRYKQIFRFTNDVESQIILFLNMGVRTQNNCLLVGGYSSLTHEEYVSKYLGLLVHENNHRSSQATFTPRQMAIPDEVDWTALGFVTPVKNQSPCGSCWAFSNVGALEAQHKNKTGLLISLSEQQLIDCSANGCDGGFMDTGFKYIIGAGGIMSQDDCPYLGKKTACKYNATAKIESMSKYVFLPPDNKTALKEAVATIGPVVIGVDSRKWETAFYSGGIYNNKECVDVDHGVLLTGYGSIPTPYWKIKNSWGTDWGEDGYMRLSQTFDGCGAAYSALYPVV